MAMPTKKLDKNEIMLVQIDQHPQFSYDPYPVSQSGQQLDLTQSKVVLEPERETLFFEKISPQLRVSIHQDGVDGISSAGMG